MRTLRDALIVFFALNNEELTSSDVMMKFNVAYPTANGTMYTMLKDGLLVSEYRKKHGNSKFYGVGPALADMIAGNYLGDFDEHQGKVD